MADAGQMKTLQARSQMSLCEAVKDSLHSWLCDVSAMMRQGIAIAKWQAGVPRQVACGAKHGKHMRDFGKIAFLNALSFVC